MAGKSKYLDRRKNEIDNETSIKIRKIESEIYRQMPSGPSDPTPYLIGGGIVGIVVWILLGSFLLGLGVFILIGIGAKAMTEGVYQDNVRTLKSALRARSDNARKAGDQRYHREEVEFKNTTLEARERYGKHLKSNDPMVQWLVAKFDNEVKAADRRPHVREVRAPLYFIVEADQIRARVHTGPLQSTKAKLVTYDFTINLYNHVPKYTDQVGLAQALAMILEYVILKRYPYDPSDRTHYPAKVEFDSNDNEITVTYVAANGNYKHPRKL